MPVAKTLSDKDWLTIKTKYEMGEMLRPLSREYGIALGTIQNRIKKEGWERRLVKQVSEIKQNIKEVGQLTNDDQYEIVTDQLKDILQLQKEVNKYVSHAVKLNLRNIQEIAKEPDLEKRVTLTARARATMADVAAISGNRPVLVENKVKDNIINIPDNAIDASRAYQELIKGE